MATTEQAAPPEVAAAAAETAPAPRAADRFREVTYPEPHRERARAILRDHPEVKALFGREPRSAGLILGIVALQLALAAALGDASLWLLVAVAWSVGAFASHTLWVLIHECAHNLVARRKRWNRVLGIVANVPHGIPSAESFRIYHLKHHKYQGDYLLDADLASAWEAKLVGNHFPGKLLWECLFPLFQSLRALRFSKASGISFLTPWVAANIVAVFAVDALVWWLLGGQALAYLLLSLVFSIGPHPLGARWVQEHFLVWDDDQETSSYYGPVNLVALNVGYHNEHHDFPFVPWNRLPQVKATAPEVYARLHAHRSWFRLWLRFLFDPRISLFSRVTRDGRINSQRAAVPFGARSDQA